MIIENPWTISTAGLPQNIFINSVEHIAINKCILIQSIWNGRIQAITWMDWNHRQNLAWNNIGDIVSSPHLVTLKMVVISYRYPVHMRLSTDYLVMWLLE
jgi:hypothetical protein